jgi:hypothetical protein
MSNISDIYARLDAIIVANFSTKTKLKNPYDLTDNDDYLLKNGYAIAWGEASDTEQLVRNATTFARNIVVRFTKQIFKTEQNTTIKETAEKALFEDELTLISKFADDFDLRKYAQQVNFVGDGGIEFVYDDKNNFIYLTVNFEIIYTEFINNK